MTDAIQLLVGTRKGAWVYRSDTARKSWRTQGPMFLGQIINHFVADPRDPNTMLMAAATGHLGPTILRSTDGGGPGWKPSARPPSPRPKVGTGRSVDHSFWVEPVTPASPGSGGSGRRRRAFFGAPTAATPGRASRA
jgi:hypothetical protein